MAPFGRSDRLVALVMAGVLIGVAGGVSSATANAPTKTVVFPVGGSCVSGEICPIAPVKLATFRSASNLTVVYTAPSGHCSDVAVRVFIGRRHVATTPFVSPSAASARVKVPWPRDGKRHTLGFEGVGKVGGCNVGILASWAGTLKVSYVPAALKP